MFVERVARGPEQLFLFMRQLPSKGIVVRTMALRQTMSFRMAATIATPVLLAAGRRRS